MTEIKDFVFNIDKKTSYPQPPFHPPSNYPEFQGIFNEFDSANRLYGNIRSLFINGGYDKTNIGTEKWNPFRGYIYDGQLVVIKPNLVKEEYKHQAGIKCITTHASVIRPIVDYLYLLQKIDNIKFKVVIADVPIQGANFNKIVEENGLSSIMEYFYNKIDFDLKLIDLRHERAIVEKSGYFKTIPVEGDPLGYTKVHLEESFLNDIVKDYKKFGAPGYGAKSASSYHKKIGEHFYHIPNTVLSADLFINVPKIKTHKKAGITVAMKNLIGINGDKGWIPHFRRGSIKNGGDEFDNKELLLKNLVTRANLFLFGKSKYLLLFARKVFKMFFIKLFRKHFRDLDGLSEYDRKAKFLIDGNWYGNDTIWRPILDLNRILIFSNKNGVLTKNKMRKYICLSDGIVAGEGDGPLDPYPKHIGLITLCENPVINDVCCSKLMGFDWQKIPLLFQSVKLKDYFNFTGDCSLIDIDGKENETACREYSFFELPDLDFLPPPGWRDYLKGV
jgi:uncharacterized protein (DUF362 family)